MITKAVQQIMLGTVIKNEVTALETLKTIRASGYDGIELCGFMIRKTAPVVRLLTRMAGMPVGSGGNLPWPNLVHEADLKVVGLHEDLGTLEGSEDLVLRSAEALGTSTVVISGMYRFDYADATEVGQLAHRLNTAGYRLKKSGITLLYHNHNGELLRTAPNQTAYQQLIRETDPGLVNFEFDSYWPAEAGADVLQIMRELGDRMKLWHINDRGARISGTSLTPILKSDSLELGDGNLPLLDLIKQAKQARVEAIILESHRNWINRSPVDSLKRSAVYLHEHI